MVLPEPFTIIKLLIVNDKLLLSLGRVLNRFSKDIGFMDDLLPFQFVELFTVSYYRSSYLLTFSLL